MLKKVVIHRTTFYRTVISNKRKRGKDMRKLTTVLLVMMTIIAITGCSSKNAYDGESTSESVQVDNVKDSGEIIEIDENSAEQLVSERLDTTQYSVKKDSDLTVDDINYYIFNVFDGETQLTMGVAVNKISGELFTYTEDKTIAPYSEFTLYDESNDVTVQWDGTFYSDNTSLELLPADANSFEFTLINTSGTDTLTGVAQISGNEATFEDEDGYTIIFIKEDDTITLTESGTNSNNTEFQGIYQ
jgi:hypothetical protein